MSIQLYGRISAILFGLVCLAHLARIAAGWAVQVDGTEVPMSVSWLAVLVTAGLAAWGFRVAGRPGG